MALFSPIVKVTDSSLYRLLTVSVASYGWYKAVDNAVLSIATPVNDLVTVALPYGFVSFDGEPSISPNLISFISSIVTPDLNNNLIILSWKEVPSILLIYGCE